MRHMTPIAKVLPLDPKDSFDKLVLRVAQARRDVREGRVYTLEEVEEMLVNRKKKTKKPATRN